MNPCTCQRKELVTIGGQSFEVWDHEQMVARLREQKDIPSDVVSWRDVVVRQAGEEQPPEDEQMGLRERIVPMTFTEEMRDRDDDVISVRGMDIESFRKDNPIVLFAHNSRDLPIGRAFNVKKLMEKDRKRIVGDVGFLSRDLNPLADTVYRLMTMTPRVMNMGSVGFRTLTARFDDDFREETGRLGILFDKTELLEFSIVPVGSNPGALAGAKAAGIDLHPLKRYLEDNLDRHHGKAFERWITAKDLEECYTICNSGRRTFLVEEKGIPSDPEGYTKADPGASWSRLTLAQFTRSQFEPGTPFEDRSAGARNAIARHFAISENSPPTAFGDLSLGHHQASNSAVVLRGVNASLAIINGARGGIDTSPANKSGAFTHLNRHRTRDFDLEPLERRAFDDAMEKQLVGELARHLGVTLEKAAEVLAIEIDLLLGKAQPPVDEENLLRAKLLEIEREGGTMKLRKDETGRIVGLDFETSAAGESGTGAPPADPPNGNGAKAASATSGGSEPPAAPAGGGTPPAGKRFVIAGKEYVVPEGYQVLVADGEVTIAPPEVVQALEKGSSSTAGQKAGGDDPDGSKGAGDEEAFIVLEDDEDPADAKAKDPEDELAEFIAEVAAEAVSRKFDQATGRLH